MRHRSRASAEVILPCPARGGVRSIDTLQMVEIVKFTPYFKRLDD
ncbi:hypothetical protein OG874_10690 [Nocardia sp. NBC_00565]|nr:hypothetical protein [Nocardia sp. NBC_00565]WUC05572.1 hypothetical protein OG874_10690 [Nocardia sp. NBC_00565]